MDTGAVESFSLQGSPLPGDYCLLEGGVGGGDFELRGVLGEGFGEDVDVGLPTILNELPYFAMASAFDK